MAAKEVHEGIREPGYQKDLDVFVNFQNVEKGRSCWAEWCRNPEYPIEAKNVVWVWQEKPMSFLGLYVRHSGPGDYFDLTNKYSQEKLDLLEQRVKNWVQRQKGDN